MTNSPAVFLIGAGPGDPGLITVRGLECLRRADVVLYDHLVSQRLLRKAHAGAELIDVGIAAPQPMDQEAISLLIAEKAREGKLVARLKWGDPFVFDRGGEEALFLQQQRIPFEVVPGIPAGIGTPAFAGVPVSYPGGGNTITFVRGYEDESRTLPDVDWVSLSHLGGTIVCYAGPQQLPRVLEALLAGGCPIEEQAVAVYDGTLPTQETLSGTIDELRDQLRERPRRGPAILIVGRVTGFREHLRWWDARPLFGRRVLVTRPRDQAAELVDQLVAAGADAVEVPMIRIEPPADVGPLLEAAGAAATGAFDWVVFTSANGVEAFMTALLDGSRDLRALGGVRLCAVGTGTAERLARYGLKVDLMPAEFRAEAVVAALAQVSVLSRTRVLLPRADIGREVVADELRAAGAAVTDVIAYRTVLEDEQREGTPDVYRLLLDGAIDVVTFTSASAVRNFARLYGADQVADLLKHTVVAAIGPVTAEAASQLNIQVRVQPTTYTVPALVEAIVEHYSAVAASAR